MNPWESLPLTCQYTFDVIKSDPIAAGSSVRRQRFTRNPPYRTFVFNFRGSISEAVAAFVAYASNRVTSTTLTIPGYGSVTGRFVGRFSNTHNDRTDIALSMTFREDPRI